MDTKRIIQFDVIRIIACFLIVLMHSPLPTERANGPFLTGLSFFTAPAIGLFFMISGTLLLPIKKSFIPFIYNRIKKIGIPLVFWTIIYLTLKIYFSQSGISVLQSIISIPFSAQGNGTLWFLYTILGLYFIAPILSSWLVNARKRDIEMVLLLWMISLCYPLLERFILINESPGGILYYFSGYAGYFLLGYYLNNYNSKLILAVSLLIGTSGVFLILYMEYSGIDYDFYRLFWYLSIFVAAWTVVYGYLISYISKFLKYNINFLTYTSKLTFGVYLIHILIMREWLWKTNFILNISNYYLQTLINVFLTFIISLGCCWVLSKIPYLRAVIGFPAKSLPLNVSGVLE